MNGRFSAGSVLSFAVTALAALLVLQATLNLLVSLLPELLTVLGIALAGTAIARVYRHYNYW